MTDLTEQWKKDELPDGHYYVRDGENIIAELLDGYFYNNGEPMTSFSGGVDEVLAPVPSYEEWEAAYECQFEESELVKTLKDLLVKAKGLLTVYRISGARQTTYSNKDIKDINCYEHWNSN